MLSNNQMWPCRRRHSSIDGKRGTGQWNSKWFWNKHSHDLTAFTMYCFISAFWVIIGPLFYIWLAFSWRGTCKGHLFRSCVFLSLCLWSVCTFPVLSNAFYAPSGATKLVFLVFFVLFFPPSLKLLCLLAECFGWWSCREGCIPVAFQLVVSKRLKRIICSRVWGHIKTCGTSKVSIRREKKNLFGHQSHSNFKFLELGWSGEGIGMINFNIQLMYSTNQHNWLWAELHTNFERTQSTRIVYLSFIGWMQQHFRFGLLKAQLTVQHDFRRANVTRGEGQRNHYEGLCLLFFFPSHNKIKWNY